MITPGDKVVYLSKFSAGIPTRREGQRALEKRYYFVWKGGDLKQADLEFFRRARVNIENSTIYMFISDDAQRKLLDLEKAFQNKTIAEIKKTRFGLLTDGAGFKFTVISQMLK